MKHGLKLDESIMHVKLTFFIKGVALSHSGRHFYSWFKRIGKIYFVRLTKFQQHFALVFRYTRWKWWHVAQSPQSNMHLKNNLKCSTPNFLQIMQKRIYLYVWISYKKCPPNLSKRTIQDSIHWLIQTICINQCIESQTEN